MQIKNVKELEQLKKCSHFGAMLEMADFEKKKIFNSLLRTALNTFEIDSVDKTMDSINKELKRKYAALEWDTKFLKNEAIENDSLVISKVLNYLKNSADEIISRNVDIELEMPTIDTILTGKIDLIYKGKDGIVHALKVEKKKPSRSLNGRNYFAKYYTDFETLLMSYYMNTNYSAEKHDVVRIYTEGNKADVLVEDQTLKGNVHFVSFTDNDEVEGYIENAYNEHVSFSCSSCVNRKMCKCETVENSKAELFEKESCKIKDFSLDSLTDEQKEICLANGNVCAMAVPGSGKTHTLVVKTLELLKKGIPGELIYLITFTEKATQEMAERLAIAGVEEANMPQVSTLHALAIRILEECEDILGYKPKILTKDAEMLLIKEQFQAYCGDTDKVPFSGINFWSLDGDMGALKRMLDLISELKKYGEDEFFRKYPDIDGGFIKFAYFYNDKLSELHYITFDDVFPLVNGLLSSDDELRENYMMNIEYLMVDEYQDVSKEQHDFVMLLTNEGNNNNLAVFGDDDQEIYAWRNGSSEFLINLSKREDFTTIRLTKNFRCAKAIVDLANFVIAPIGNRVSKKAISNAKDGSLVRYNGKDISDVERTINWLVKEKGYNYGDIAVMARANSVLENVANNLKVPSVLQKRYLRNTALVHILNSLIKGVNDKKSVYIHQLLHLLDLEIPNNLSQVTEKDDENYYVVRELMHTMESFDERAVSETVKRCANILGLSDSEEEKALVKLVEDNEIETISELRNTINSLIENSSDIKLDIAQKDRVILITQHEAKGQEWPVVIYISSDRKENQNDEGTRKLFYVTVTRAKETFIVLGDSFSALLEDGIRQNKFCFDKLAI